MSFPRLSKWLLPLTLGLPLLTGACGAPLALSGVSYGADGVSLAGSGKSTTDHLTSIVTKKDCALWRVFRNQSVCHPREDGKDPYDTDYSTPNRTSSDGSVEYEAPAKSNSDAPAFAWDSSAYKKLAETAAPAAPDAVKAEATAQPVVTASTETSPPQAAPAAPKKAKKPVHARSGTKTRKKSPAAKQPVTPASPDPAATGL